MADFSDIPTGIPRKIAFEHLDNQEDFETFKQVCSLWSSETKDIQYLWPRNNYQLPWLMLVDSADNNQYRRLYSLSKDKFREIKLPRLDKDPEDHRMYFSSKGWLVSVTRKRALINFFHVFTSQLIVPPSVPILSLNNGDIWDDESYLARFHKFIFSHKPSPSSEDDLQVAMVFDITLLIAFWTPRQHQWIKPADNNLKISQVEDVCFFKGEFYSIDHYTQVIAYGNQTPKQPRIVANLKSQGLLKDVVVHKVYIVGLQASNTLLVIHKGISVPEDSDDEYWTLSFDLFEVNVDDGKATQVRGIRDRALFIGRCSTFFVEACPSKQSGYRPNCIYFTDDNSEQYCSSAQGGGRDIGVFSLDENKVVDQVYEGPSKFDYVTPPMWVQLPPY